MATRKRKRSARKLPRLAMLDLSQIQRLTTAIDSMHALAAELKNAVPMLLELSTVCRALAGITSRMHQEQQELHAAEQTAAEKRSAIAKKAAATRAANQAAASSTRSTPPAAAGESTATNGKQAASERLADGTNCLEVHNEEELFSATAQK